VNDLGLKRGAADERSTAELDGLHFHEFFVLTWESVRGREPIHFAVLPEHEGVVRLAQADSRCHKGIEHGLQIEGRAG